MSLVSWTLTQSRLQVSGIVHELDGEGDIVSKYYPGSICGIKLLMLNGNVVHTFSLHAGTDVEMLEFNIACSHDMFHDILQKDPERFVVPAHRTKTPNDSSCGLYPRIVPSKAQTPCSSA
jgi:hypothetical protein